MRILSSWSPLVLPALLAGGRIPRAGPVGLPSRSVVTDKLSLVKKRKLKKNREFLRKIIKKPTHVIRACVFMHNFLSVHFSDAKEYANLSLC